MYAHMWEQCWFFDDGQITLKATNNKIKHPQPKRTTKHIFFSAVLLLHSLIQPVVFIFSELLVIYNN